MWSKGAGSLSAVNWGGGGAKYFFPGPKCPPRLSEGGEWGVGSVVVDFRFFWGGCPDFLSRGTKTL